MVSVSSLLDSVHAAAILCGTASFLLHLNTLGCGFCFDDLSAVQQNQDLRSSTPWTNLLWNDFWGTPMHVDGSHKSYRPLCVASFRLNYMLHGLDPMGYHLVNVILHAVVCYLYVQLCAVVFNTTTIWPALVAGLLFATHPIHTEAVSGVVGRAELISALLFLLALLSYRQATLNSNQNPTSKGTAWLACSLVFCLMSVLSKEQGITAIAVCLTYDLFIVHNHTIQSVLLMLVRGKSVPRPLLGRITVLVVFTAAVLYLRLQIMHTTLPVFTVHDNPAVALPTPYRQLQWLYLVFVNLWLLLCPSFLCADWTMGTIRPFSSLADIRHLATLVSVIVLLVLIAYSLTYKTRRAKTILFALCLMVFPFLPASNLFFPVGFVVAERVLYVPSMGFSLLVSYGLWMMVSPNMRGLLQAGLLFTLGVHSLKTVVRNQDWRDDRSLFQSAIRINPSNGKLYNNLGHDYEQMENFSYAEKLFGFATKVQPDDIGAFINVGRMLKQLGQPQKAEEAYKQAIELMPTGKSFRVAPSHINVYYNFANLVKTDVTRLQEAQMLYSKAISLKEDFVEAHMNKGDLLLMLNKTEEARQSFLTALRHNPQYVDAHYNLATALLQLGRLKDAEKSYRNALALNSAHIHSLLGLAWLMHEEDHNTEALHLFQQVLLLDADNVRASFNLALVYLDMRDLDKAEAMFLRALAIDPTYRSALYNIGVLYNYQQKVPQAITRLKLLVQLYPDHLNGAQLLGDCYFKSDQLELAEAVYKHILVINPNHVSALHNLGVVKAEGSHYDDALSLFKQVLLIDPSHSTSKKHVEQAERQLLLQKSDLLATKETANILHKQPRQPPKQGQQQRHQRGQ